MSVRFVETLDGHNWASWRDSLGVALPWLLTDDGPEGWSSFAAVADVTPPDRALARRRPVLADLLRGGAAPPRPGARHRRGHGALRGRPGHDRAVRPPPAVALRPRRRPPDALVHDEPRVDQEGRPDGRAVRVQQPVGHPVDGEAHVVLRHDASRHADPGDVDRPAEGLRVQARPRRSRSSRYARLFDLDEVGAAVGYPLFAKPFDGGGWAGVSRVDDGAALHRAYDDSGTYLLHLQRAVEPHDLFVRCIGFGPQTRLVRYDPSAPLHDRYTMDDGAVPDDQRQTLIDTTLTINSFFGWEFNSCEALRQGDTWHPIDFANACPDSQVTSLHYHFPWLVAANLRWSIFCAATKRPMPINLDWAPYFEIADSDAPVRREARRRTRRSPGSASRPPSSSRSAPPTCRTSIRSCGSSSPPRRPTTPCARRWRRSSRPTRSTSSPTCSGTASSSGAHDSAASV